MSEDAPAHPGPRPASLEFPFAEAHAVIAAIDTELDDLATCSVAHQHGTGHALTGAAGLFPTQFTQQMDTRLDDLSLRRQQLEDQREEVRSRITFARDMVRGREQSIRHWQQQMTAYRDAS